MDFAHLHAVTGGAYETIEMFANALNQLEAGLGLELAKQMHVHFSRIEFGSKGEIRHKTFADTDYGPDFALLAPLLIDRGYQGTLICESRGTMAEDAHVMKTLLEQAKTSAAEYKIKPAQ